MNHKVKGMGMSNFKEVDVAQILKWGNAKAEDHWMAGHNKTLYPIPERRDLTKMKEFMKMKYVQKRFLEEEDNSDSSDEDSDEAPKKKSKKKKKKAKAKKSKKKKKKQTSSDSDSDDDSEEEEKEPEKVTKPKKGGFKAVSKAKSKLSRPKATSKPAKAPVEEKPKKDEFDVLGLGLETAPAPASNTGGGNEWANFESGSQQENKEKQGDNDLWGAFDTPTQNEKKTNDLVSHLGDLYGQAAQTQQQQTNPFGAFGMPNMPQAPTQAPTNNFGMPQTQPQAQPQPQSKFLDLILKEKDSNFHLLFHHLFSYFLILFQPPCQEWEECLLHPQEQQEQIHSCQQCKRKRNYNLSKCKRLKQPKWHSKLLLKQMVGIQE